MSCMCILLCPLRLVPKASLMGTYSIEVTVHTSLSSGSGPTSGEEHGVAMKCINFEAEM